MDGKGREIRKDYIGVDEALLLDGERLASLMEQAAIFAGSTIESINWKNLGGDTPPGCTVAVLLNESHGTIHSYSELGMLAINIFTCGEYADPNLAFEFLERELGHPEVVFMDDAVRFRVGV